MEIHLNQTVEQFNFQARFFNYVYIHLVLGRKYNLSVHTFFHSLINFSLMKKKGEIRLHFFGITKCLKIDLPQIADEHFVMLLSNLNLSRLSSSKY